MASHCGCSLKSTLQEVKAKTGALPDHFPQAGLLSFWMRADDDDLMEMDLSNLCSEQGSRVLYFPDVVEDKAKLCTEFPLHYPGHPHRQADGSLCSGDCPGGGGEYGPIQWECVFKPSFALETQYMTHEDFRWRSDIEPLVGKLPPAKQDAFHRVRERHHGDRHRLGGYPSFTHEDPRPNYPSYTVMLLQLVSGGPVLWGCDCGMGQFYHTPSATEKGQFAKALFTWDCC